ncbi:IclR family transcriptional regulator [Aurantimonas sp. A2-1-M11]|uniref:IclR family transcriptional regulator n=1 Tax=Aurantimonas sp. A2-1-M11 TaxID=3113712 RepID=UPI002F9552CB
MSGTREAETSSRARGVDRSVDILNHLAEVGEARRPNEISAALGAPRSSTYDLVHALLRTGLLDRADDEGRVFLGRRVFMLGLAYQDRFDLFREARNTLAELSKITGETSQLCLLDGAKYTVALMHEGPRPFRISASVGERVPIPWTASGRLLLAHLDDAGIEATIPPEDFTLPSGSRIAVADFIDEVRAASRDGYYVAESIVDTYTRCFAAPVVDSRGITIATACLVAPREDGLRNEVAYIDGLCDAAAQLTAKCGGVSASRRRGMSA